FLRQFMEETFRGELVSLVGVSSMHNTLTELKQALQEAFFASVFLTREEEACRFRYFDRLGTYQILFPYCHTPEFAAFSRRITEKIEEYDTENNTHLLNTLLTYIQCDASLTETARQLSQHQQTIRYRLNKIYDLTGLDRKSPADCEQLSLAARIHIARRLLEGSV
ncbi:MAG: PucR family transcriptional regulator, partial [Anaerovoracaceae bacterium]